MKLLPKLEIELPNRTSDYIFNSNRYYRASALAITEYWFEEMVALDGVEKTTLRAIDGVLWILVDKTVPPFYGLEWKKCNHWAQNAYANWVAEKILLGDQSVPTHSLGVSTGDQDTKLDDTE